MYYIEPTHEVEGEGPIILVLTFGYCDSNDMIPGALGTVTAMSGHVVTPKTNGTVFIPPYLTFITHDYAT